MTNEAILNRFLGDLIDNNPGDGYIAKDDIQCSKEYLMCLEAMTAARQDEREKMAGEAAHHVPYQLCPKCNGQGLVSRPPYVAGDIYEWTSGETIFPCDVCNGAKIISMMPLAQSDSSNIMQINKVKIGDTVIRRKRNGGEERD